MAEPTLDALTEMKVGGVGKWDYQDSLIQY